MKITEIVTAYGHANIQATHKSTFEITKEKYMSKKGDCIIAALADKAVANLSPKFKANLRMDNARMTLLIEAEKTVEVINAFGSPRLILTHPTDIVVRKSSYICDRTLAIQADKAACDLTRKLVKKLRKPNQKVNITITVKV